MTNTMKALAKTQPAEGLELITAPIPSPGEIAAAAPATDWIAIAPSDLLVMVWPWKPIRART